MMSGQELLRLEEEINGFRLEEILGRDIDSRLIFKSVNYKKQRRVIKILDVKQGFLDAALNQALFYCQINHPNITKAYDFNIRNRNRQIAMFMEYCQENLAENLKTKPVEDQEINIYAKVITETILHIHDYLNIAHCDIRLESIQIVKQNGLMIPKVSFYNVTMSDSVPAECYTPFDFAHQHQKQADIWALGLLLLELFSKKRITEILPELKDRWKPAFKAQGFNSMALFQGVKNLKIRHLLRDVLQRNAKQRPSIKQIFDRLCNAIACPQLFQSDMNQLTLNSRSYRKQQVPVVPSFQRRKTNNATFTTNPITTASSLRQRHQKRVSQKQMISSINSDIFRLTNIKDRSKMKILNLSNMKITKIEQIYGTPCLQWLYLQNNFIEKIENLEYPSLQGLNLGSNKIGKIQNLQFLGNLTELYLQNNKITRIQNLEENGKLKWLYLNDNYIKKIDPIIQQQRQLKTLALRNNNIDGFQPDNNRVITTLRNMGVQVYI